jgi:hypothetical protein
MPKSALKVLPKERNRIGLNANLSISSPPCGFLIGFLLHRIDGH